MAAYAALTSLSETTDLLHEIILQSIASTDGNLLLLQQLENKIESLRGNINSLRSFLEKSPTNEFGAHIKDAADQAEGIIGRFVSEQLRSKSVVDGVILKSVRGQLERVHDDIISPMVEKINKSVGEKVYSDEEPIEILDSSASRLVPLTRNKVAYGFEDVFQKLSNLVIKVFPTELRVVSIVGMGGMGKTTVARTFYNDPAISEQFEVRGWVTVSQDFSARDIMVSLMALIQPFVRYPKERNESIENHVRKNLKGRTFLIVLDDVWSPEALRFLMRTLPDDCNSSRILLTTRQKEVADKANPKGPMCIVMMRLMDWDESYYLLLRNVFQEDHCPLELVDLARSIALECERLPLAIVLVAGILLAHIKSLHGWKYVLEKIASAHKSGHELVDFLLSLSYMHLPHRVRSCLLYLGAFPEDHEINVSRLTKQLLAQDFLRYPTCSGVEQCRSQDLVRRILVSSSSGSSEVEDCLEDLVKRNFVSVLKWKSDYRIKSICLHDMVRDFCLKKAQEEKFLHYVMDNHSANRDLMGRKIKVTFSSENLKRTCISDDVDETRTIMCFGRGRTRGPLTSIGRFTLLKSLYVVNVEIESFPMEVLKLFLLRSLALCHVPEIPPSISNLQYLETLMINPRYPSSSSMTLNLPSILCIPFEIWTMPRLRHIISFCCGALPSPKQVKSPLRNLQTLSAVMNLDCSSELVEMIPNIKKLVIFYFGVERATHSIKNIKRLHTLEKLKLWVLVPFSAPQNLDLCFPITLRKLTLRGIQLSHRDMYFIGELPNLEVLKLRHNNFERDEWIITRYGFRELKNLLLEELGLSHWLSDRGKSFILPMLQTLSIRTCKQLHEIPEFVENIPSLELIEVVGCKKKSLLESAQRIELWNVYHNHNNLEVRIKNYG